MRWYRRCLDDYDSSTGHLSLLEHGVYTILLDQYYRRGTPLPDDRPALYRLIRAMSEAEQDATERVIQEFWVVSLGGLTNPRADKEIEAWRRRSATNRQVAERRWARRSYERKSASARPSSAACPYEEIIQMYHEMLPMLPRQQKRTATRDRHMRARWHEHPGLERFKNFFGRVQRSPFLLGRVVRPNARPFLATLDWLMKPENFAKVLEEKYVNDRG